MNVILFTNLPTEVIDIIIYIIRKINLSIYFYINNINFETVLHIMKLNKCILAAKFTDEHKFIDFTIYGEHSKGNMHSFESQIDWINLPKDRHWRQDMVIVNSKYIKYERCFYANVAEKLPNRFTFKAFYLRFVSVNVKLNEFAKTLNHKDVLILE